MLNEYLPLVSLHQSLSDYLESWNWILGQINAENKISLYQNRKLLSSLHHSLNIGKYSQAKFRNELLLWAPEEKILEFVKKAGISYDSFNDLKSPDFRRKISFFPWGNNKTTEAFVTVFGYPLYLIPSAQESLVVSEIIPKSDSPYMPLKDYQSQIFFDSLKMVEFPNTRFLIQMPTGSGKTRVAMEIVTHFMNKNKGRKAVWLVDRQELCDQAVETFTNVWSHAGNADLRIYRLWGNIPLPNKFENSAFIIAMYQKIREPLRNGQISLKTDLIVTDEAHNILAPTYSEVIENLKDRHTKQTRILGLTATPGRKKGESVENIQLASFFNNKIIKIDSGEKGVISFLQGKRILARAIRKPLDTNIVYRLTPEEWKKLARSYSREYPEELLERIANDQKRNLIITLRLNELAKEYKHILVFAASKKQSKLLCGLMMAQNYSAVHVDGESPKSYRTDVVNKFKDGKIQFVFNYGVFTAGFDAPKIESVVIARPTISVVLYGQMIGRGMRGIEIGGTEEFHLIDVVDNIITEHTGLENVYEYFSDYWEEGQ